MYIDTHCHFDAQAFNDDRNAVFKRAQDAGVRQIISPATTASSWAGLTQLCRRFSQVLPTYGLHPMFMDEHLPEHLEQLEHLLQIEKPVAVGECGLDFYQGRSDQKTQRDYFSAQLALAVRFNLPVIIHARKAVQEVLLLVREYSGVRGVLHSYSGSVEQAEQLIELGFNVGFGGPVTWSRSKRLHRVIDALPLESMLLETDAPDQPGERHRGKRNEPAWLVEVAEKISQIKNLSVEEVATVTSTNAKTLFQL